MGFGNPAKMMAQLQRMQADMARVQAELETAQVEGTAGGGAVTVVVTGQQEVVSIAIDPGVVDPADVEMLQDLVTAAVNDGLRRSREMMQQRMAAVTPDIGGLGGIPGLG
jgi:DNA-binding YbaB/EbfC family protein